MSSESLPLVEGMLRDGGFAVRAAPQQRVGLLAEDVARIAYCAFYDSVSELLASWEDEQTWFVNYVGESVSPDKSWELYLLLASEAAATAGELPGLEAIRRDARFAKKLVLVGLAAASPARIRAALGSLSPFEPSAQNHSSDVLDLVRAEAVRQERDDAVRVLEAFRANRPLFEGLT
jgi:hypothetical protein